MRPASRIASISEADLGIGLAIWNLDASTHARVACKEHGQSLEPPLDAALFQETIVLTEVQVRLHLPQGVQKHTHRNEQGSSAEEGCNIEVNLKEHVHERWNGGQHCEKDGPGQG